MNRFENITNGIKKTGFILEFEICKILEKHNWIVINNRYYIDDLKNVEREIDIVAYRTKSKEDIAFYTVLIISCKKSENNIWAFLTKNYNKNDPNINFYPIINWTNVDTLKYMLTKMTPSVLKKIINKSKNIKSLYKLDKQVFAFQEMNKITGKQKNDENIYNSIVTTIKALEYERRSLNKRKKTKAFYNFNLISILDGEMVDINFDSSELVTSEIDNIKYLNRHIINNKEEFYRVHFIKKDGFESILNKYNSLVDWNFSGYYNLFKSYYVDVFNYEKRVKVLWKEFTEEILFWINLNTKIAYKEITGKNLGTKVKSVDYEYDNKAKILNIIIVLTDSPTYVDDDINNELNKDSYLMKKIKEKLLKWYRYKGKFRFSEPQIPF